MLGNRDILNYFERFSRGSSCLSGEEETDQLVSKEGSFGRVAGRGLGGSFGRFKYTAGWSDSFGYQGITAANKSLVLEG